MSRAKGEEETRGKGEKTKQKSKREVEMNGDVFEFVGVLEELILEGELGENGLRGKQDK